MSQTRERACVTTCQRQSRPLTCTDKERTQTPNMGPEQHKCFSAEPKFTSVKPGSVALPDGLPCPKSCS